MNDAYADWGFEDRLITRISLKQAVAARLTPREGEVLRARLMGDTLSEIADRWSRTPERVREIEHKAIHKLRHPVSGLREAPVSGFDKAAFLRHITGLKQAEDRRRVERYHAAMADLERMVEREAPKPEPPRPRPAASWAPPSPRPTPQEPVPPWLLDRLWEAGEYLQVYRYLAGPIGERFGYYPEYPGGKKP